MANNPSDISKNNISRLGQGKGSENEALLSRLSGEIRRSEEMLNPWKQRVVRYYELYKMYQHKRHYEGLAEIFVPEILRAVETIVGNLYRFLSQNNPPFEYQGRTKDEDAAAAALTQLVLYQMDENGFRSRLMDSLRQMAITGLTVRKVLWDFKQVARTRKNWVEMPGDKLDPETGKPLTYKKWGDEPFTDTVKDHWTFEPVDLLSLLIPDISVPYNDIQKSRWIGEQYTVDKQWIKEKTKKGWLVKTDEEEYELNSENSKNNFSQSKVLRDDRLRSSGFTVKTNKPGGVEIFERWGLLPAKYVYDEKGLEENDLDADDEIETVCIVANRCCLLKLEANPFYHQLKPYLFCPYVPVEFEFTGIGVGQIGEKLQEELNDTRNQTMDNKTLILMCMWLKSRTSGIKNQDLRVRPLGVIATNEMDGLQPLRPPVLTGVGVNIEGTIKNDLRESVGAASNLQGIAQSGVSSATEASLINKDAMGRLALNQQLYGELVYKPMLLMAEYLNYQFYDHEKTIRILGPQGMHYKKITPEMLVGYKDIVLNTPADNGDPATRRQQELQFLAMIQQMPPQMIEFHWKLLDKIYQDTFGGRGLDELYEPPPDEKQLLTTDQEVDLIINGYPLVPQKRSDAIQHVKELEKEYLKVRWALSHEAHEVFTAVILGYQKMATEQLKAQQMMMLAQMASESGGGMVPGQQPGMTPFTQPSNPTPPPSAQASGVAG